MNTLKQIVGNEKAVSVAVPSRWRNPFHHCCDFSFRKDYERELNRLYYNPSCVYEPGTNNHFELKDVHYNCMNSERILGHIEVRLFVYALLNNHLLFTVEDVRKELAGKDLGCRCKKGIPCHADALLRIANDDVWGSWRSRYNKLANSYKAIPKNWPDDFFETFM